MKLLKTHSLNESTLLFMKNKVDEALASGVNHQQYQHERPYQQKGHKGTSYSPPQPYQQQKR